MHTLMSSTILSLNKTKLASFAFTLCNACCKGPKVQLQNYNYSSIIIESKPLTWHCPWFVKKSEFINTT
jgi:hypothetical protein